MNPEDLRRRLQGPHSDELVRLVADWVLDRPLEKLIDPVFVAHQVVTALEVSAQGAHEGGYILPGADLMRRALSSETDRIRVGALEAPAIGPGNNTQACVTAGSWRAVMGAVESTMAAYPDHRPLLTGGAASTLRDLGLVATVSPDLVMEGLRLWLSQTLDDQSP